MEVFALPGEIGLAKGVLLKLQVPETILRLIPDEEMSLSHRDFGSDWICDKVYDKFREAEN